MRILIKFLILLLICFNSAAAEKYCKDDSTAKSYDIHLFAYTFADESQKKNMLRGLNELKNKFQIGDRVRVFQHKPQGYNVVMDQCVPGCAEKGFFEGFLDSSCSVQIANKDKVLFQQIFAKSIFEDLKKEPKEYDIFRSVQTLADFYASNSRKSEVYAAISMVPYQVSPRDKAKLDSLFVKGVTQFQLPSSNFPSVVTIGSAPDKELMDFWREIFNYKKIKFNITTF